MNPKSFKYNFKEKTVSHTIMLFLLLLQFMVLTILIPSLFIPILLLLILNFRKMLELLFLVLNFLKIFQLNLGRVVDILEDLLERRLTCPICLDNLLLTQALLFLNCGHFFHFPCIREWVVRNHTCPVCRGIVE